MSKAQERRKASSDEPNSDAKETADSSDHSAISRMWQALRKFFAPVEWYPLLLEEDEILPPEPKSLKELRIIVPPNISPEALVIVGCWGDSLPGVKLARSEQLMTMQLHDESTSNTASHDLIYGGPEHDSGPH